MSREGGLSKKPARWLYAVMLAALAVFLFAAPVYADLSQRDYYSTGDDAAVDIYGANWYAQTFTTSEAYSISSVRLKIYRLGEPGTATVSIRETDDGGDPTGGDLCSGTINANTITTDTSGGWYEVEFSSNYDLEASTQYAVIVRAVAGDSSNYVGWRYDSTGTLADGNYEASTNGGMSWTANTSYDFMFSTWGDDVLEVISGKVFSGYLEDDDWLIVVHYLNEYPPYAGTESPGDYFDLQLLAGGNLTAQVKLPAWGNKPGSIYLSKAMADQLEWGSAYSIRMYGRFGSNPSVSLTLTSQMWSGSDLTVLDDWVLNTASLIGDYYDTAMTTYVDGNLEVLNAVGGTIFSVGIPRLGHIRPHLFEHPPMDIDYEADEFDREYEDSFVWDNLLGEQIVDDAGVVGAIFGLTGLQMLQVAFVGAWLTSTGVVAALAGTPAVLVTIPFLIIGVMTGLLPIAIFAIVSSLLILVMIWVFWLRGT